LAKSSDVKGYFEHDVAISVVSVCSSHLGCLLLTWNLAARFPYIAGHKVMFLAAGLLLSKLAASFN
jgi:hypothetical protein